MRLAKDYSGAPTIVEKMECVAGTYYVGAGVAAGSTDGTDISLVKPATAVNVNFVGMCNEAKVTTGTLQLHTVETIEVIRNPFAVYYVEYDITGTGITPAGYSAPSLTFSCTSGLGHPNLGGGYVYRIVDPGAGELNLIKSSAVSSTTCTVTLDDACTTAITTTSRFHLIYPKGPYMIVLGDSGRKIDSNDLDSGGGTSGTDGLPVTILDNYIGYDGIPDMTPLRAGDHADLTDLDSHNVHFYAAICFFPGSIWVE